MKGNLQVPPAPGVALPSITAGASTVPVKLDEQTTASATSLTLTVPAGAFYRILEIDFTGRSDQAAAQILAAQFNADVGGNYDYQTFSDINNTVAGVAAALAQTSGKVAALVASGATAGAISGYRVTIQNADSTTQRKNWQFIGNRWDTDAVASANLEVGGGQWRNASNAITSIKLLVTVGNIINGRAILYGRP